jgi:hydroxyacylglutathione hydrolase
MTLQPLPAFADNYIWMLHDGHRALVVDPGDAQPVLDALQREGVRLEAILVTHHHPDHTGGIDVLRNATGAPVYGPARESIPAPFLPLEGGAVVQALGMSFDVIDVPGHTRGHIAYHCAVAKPSPLLFCGDTLFSGGCGRIFEGTPAQLQHSLGLLAALSGTTRVCCTHEYTLGNLKFAQEVEPDNAALKAHMELCRRLRAAGQPTLPSTIAQERAINPFLRTDVPTIVASAQAHDAGSVAHHGVFATLREWKNHYR